METLINLGNKIILTNESVGYAFALSFQNRVVADGGTVEAFTPLVTSLNNLIEL